ncbi:MAG: alcohol dehydrogenase catalytic domain-containing protein [Eubacteriales bacterium]|nr:alcohol dehydrogenase catalytic domain-containing protein [Eubacteriales bacterium]
MKAVQFMEPEVIQVNEVPDPVMKDNEVVAKVEYAGICGTDMDLLTGDMVHIKNGMTKYPIIPGHEWSGTVIKVGKDVKGFKVGDRVTADVSLGCGECPMCRKGFYNLCPNREVIGSYRNRQGAFAEKIAAPQRHLYKIPDGVSMEEAALVEPAGTAAYAVKRANITMGSKVLIMGDGPIGQLAAQFAKLNGASQVIVSGSWDEKLAVARECGADATINYHNVDTVEEVIRLTDGGPDVIIESTGNAMAVNQAIKAVKPNGKIVFISWYTLQEIPIPMNQVIVKNLDLICTLASPNVFDAVLDYMATGKINVKPLITHVEPLEKVSDMIKLVREKKVYRNKILLKP